MRTESPAPGPCSGGAQERDLRAGQRGGVFVAPGARVPLLISSGSTSHPSPDLRVAAMARMVELTTSGSPRNVRASARCRNPLRTAGERCVTHGTPARGAGQATPLGSHTYAPPWGAFPVPRPPNRWAPLTLTPPGAHLGTRPRSPRRDGREPRTPAGTIDPASPSLVRRRAEYWAANSLSWACRGPASTAGLSSHCRVCTSTLRKRDEKPVSWGTQRWGRHSTAQTGPGPGGTIPPATAGPPAPIPAAQEGSAVACPHGAQREMTKEVAHTWAQGQVGRTWQNYRHQVGAC